MEGKWSEPGASGASQEFKSSVKCQLEPLSPANEIALGAKALNCDRGTEGLARSHEIEPKIAIRLQSGSRDMRQVCASRLPRLPVKLELLLRLDEGSTTPSRMEPAAEVGAIAS